jgi:TonB-dependent SusC/RagA subfamily outer membrane receptor
MKFKILILLFVSVIITNTIEAQPIAKKIQVSGYITDVNNQPIKDAVLLVDDVKIDTYINSKGFYKIKIPSNSKVIMVFSLGSGLKEHQFQGESTVNFTFSANNNQQMKSTSDNDNQVDVGYGSSNKQDLTSSVGVVDIDKNNTYRNIYEMIAGKVPGVMVTGRSITIRGLSSVNAGTEPLYVVNGSVINSIDDIPPSDVDNISILKGSSAAMYGSRGSNGVILINLKKAKKGN